MAHKRTRGLARLFFGTVPDDQIQRAYRVRVGLFFVLVVIIVVALFLIYQLTQTLYQLNLAEGERDQWQRPDDVIESLKLKDSDVVADVGCGVLPFSCGLLINSGQIYPKRLSSMTLPLRSLSSMCFWS
jgi:hypothetical protein